MAQTILIVDDEEPVRHMFCRLFESRGYRVLSADSAERGAVMASEGKPDLVITDLKMTGKDGLWLAHELLTWDPDMPIMLITAYADLGSAQRAVSLGIYEYFTKPVDLQQISVAVQRGLEYRRLALENKIYQKDLERRVEARTRDLERAYQELIQAEKTSEVGRLAAGIVHEVLNPLSVVMGRIEMVLMDEELGVKHIRSLELACEQLNRAVKIMDNLRGFSKQRPAQRAETDANSLIDHTLELMVYELRKSSIAVKTNFQSLPVIMADGDQLSQVFLNLVKNAIEAMPNGGTLRIDTRKVALRSELGIEIKLADSGTGIEKENISRLFDLFFTTKKNGTGLGLGICRGIVEAHGGTLDVESQIGEGTTFTIFLPEDGHRQDSGNMTEHTRGESTSPSAPKVECTSV